MHFINDTALWQHAWELNHPVTFHLLLHNNAAVRAVLYEVLIKKQCEKGSFVQIEALTREQAGVFVVASLCLWLWLWEGGRQESPGIGNLLST